MDEMHEKFPLTYQDISPYAKSFEVFHNAKSDFLSSAQQYSIHSHRKQLAHLNKAKNSLLHEFGGFIKNIHINDDLTLDDKVTDITALIFSDSGAIDSEIEGYVACDNEHHSQEEFPVDKARSDIESLLISSESSSTIHDQLSGLYLNKLNANIFHLMQHCPTYERSSDELLFRIRSIGKHALFVAEITAATTAGVALGLWVYDKLPN